MGKREFEEPKMFQVLKESGQLSLLIRLKNWKDMKAIKLKPRIIDEKIMDKLEELNLVKRMIPKEGVRSVRLMEAVDDIIYVADPKFGSHMLLRVRLNSPVPILGTHPEREEFILINREKRKPLFVIIALHKHKELEKLIEENSLSKADFLALEMVYNDPNLSFFTMLNGTPHCELTSLDRGPPPYFFVTEPSDLPWDPIDLNEYVLTLFDCKECTIVKSILER